MVESGDFDDDWTTKDITWRVSVGCEASTRIAALINLQIEMVDTRRVPCLREYAFDSLEVLYDCALEGRLASLGIDVYCCQIPISGRYGRQ